ncbi:MAG: hypothetical protein Q9218_004572 [Villophora microphyllina]
MVSVEEDPENGLLSSQAVIIEEPETLSSGASPSLEGCQPPEVPVSPKQYRASLGSRRLSGRPSSKPSFTSLRSTTSLEDNPDVPATDGPPTSGQPQVHSKHHHHHHANHILSQVRDWLHHEKARKTKHKSRLPVGHANKEGATDALKALAGQVHHALPKPHTGHHRRHSSEASDGAVALEELEKILTSNFQIVDDDTEATSSSNRKASLASKRGSMRRMSRKKSTGISSDTDHQEVDTRVPSADVVLDNSKTLSYSGGGAASSQTSLHDQGKGAKKEAEAWKFFKNEIVRLAHTLKLTGWRRVPLERGADIDVERLSGALTNAVYVVSPPKDLPHPLPGNQSETNPLAARKPPVSVVTDLQSNPQLTGYRKLLLRIYGPQSEHLIDRDTELQILRRLARQNIGPKMLGTFTNGRFEQFFNARTLTAEDIRRPETSKQIAKRMRELHEGIELLAKERNAGPFVWQNWDKWKGRCEEVISWIDEKMIAGKGDPAGTGLDARKRHGLVCGVEWSVFRKTVEKYRKWLEDQSGGLQGVKDKLVFAHNDVNQIPANAGIWADHVQTQYGNILRERPSGESPLLLPQNEHKQLIVIDFEYASANVPGLEFANHFTEWCYNYHNASKPFTLNEHNYPTPEEQHRFVKAYVQHRTRRPSLSTQSSSASLRPTLSHSISNFMLDSRAPPAQIAEEEKQREAAIETETQRLLQETRLWRPANSAFWTAWGIIQAKFPGMSEALDARKAHDESVGTPPATGQAGSDPLSPELQQMVIDVKEKRPEEASGGEGVGDGEEGEDEFDYLAYARERAMFFWGDMLRLGMVTREELPEELRGRVKVVDY